MLQLPSSSNPKKIDLYLHLITIVIIGGCKDNCKYLIYIKSQDANFIIKLITRIL